MKVLGFITLTLCCIAAPLAAQDTSHHPGMRPGMGRPGMDEMMGMMREMMAPMVGVIAYTPGHLLAQKDSLKLTPDQVTKLTNIESSAKTAHEAGAADFKTHMGAVSQAFLTDAQRQKVDAWVTMMQQRMQQEHTM